MRLQSLIPLFVSRIFAQTPPPAPGFTYLYTSNVTLSTAIANGVGSNGPRVTIPIIGGTVEGPRLNGTILAIGADWGWTDTHDPSGVTIFHPDARYNLRTSDGANIFVQSEGVAQTDGTIHLRLKLETGSADYYWLNNIVVVGILKSGTGYVVIDAWQVTSPV